jgi:hypothetical protein
MGKHLCCKETYEKGEVGTGTTEGREREARPDERASVVPGEPQKSVKGTFGENFELNPKSHNLQSIHCSFVSSKVNKIFSGFKSMKGKMQKTRDRGKSKIEREI